MSAFRGKADILESPSKSVRGLASRTAAVFVSPNHRTTKPSHRDERRFPREFTRCDFTRCDGVMVWSWQRG